MRSVAGELQKRTRRRRRTVPLRPAGVRVTVRGPADPAEADALRRAIVTDLARLAHAMLSDGGTASNEPAEERTSGP